MERYIIKGGVALNGKVEISGAKNAALGLLAASIMTDEDVTIENLPDVSDINQLIDAIERIGATVTRNDRHSVTINGSTIKSHVVKHPQMKKIRASYYLIGALLGKFNKAEVPLPGGCNIGSRPIDQHIKCFRALGADVIVDDNIVTASAEHLVGRNIFLDVVSVGATINVMLASVCAYGKTVIENVAKEPHVVDVANMLNSMGANIRGAGTDKIRIVGVPKLHGTVYSTIPDQIEAGTFMCAAAATGGEILVKNVIPRHLECISAKLMEIGCTVIEYDDAVRVKAGDVIRSAKIKTLVYPGFPTDMQAQMAVALALAKGNSTITESIFENRFQYTDELNKMGADFIVKGSVAEIKGVCELHGEVVSSTDLRAGAALVIAGMAAKGITIVENIIYIQRGYEKFEEKLLGLGAIIAKVKSVQEEKQFVEEVS